MLTVIAVQLEIQVTCTVGSCYQWNILTPQSPYRDISHCRRSKQETLPFFRKVFSIDILLCDQCLSLFSIDILLCDQYLSLFSIDILLCDQYLSLFKVDVALCDQYLSLQNLKALGLACATGNQT